MSNIKAMTEEQLKGYMEYLLEGVSRDFSSGLFDGENFADLIEIHDYCRERLIAVDEELQSRKAVE